MDPQTLPMPPAFTDESQPHSQVPDPDFRVAVFGTHLFVQGSFLWQELYYNNINMVDCFHSNFTLCRKEAGTWTRDKLSLGKRADCVRPFLEWIRLAPSQLGVISVMLQSK